MALPFLRRTGDTTLSAAVGQRHSGKLARAVGTFVIDPPAFVRQTEPQPNDPALPRTQPHPSAPLSLTSRDRSAGRLLAMDRITRERRSANMARIRNKDTAPELAVRHALHAAGLRYRLHDKRLSGRPDLVFPRRKLCLFVHGCFWHGCPDCVDGRRAVKSNTGYWSAKIAGNRERDVRHQAALEAAGWTVITFWECMSRDPGALQELAATIRAINSRRA